jgi:hypothetical protein
MKTLSGTLNKATRSLGTAMAIIWTLWLGPVGMVLLLSVLFAMTAGQRTGMVLCALLMSVPFFLTLAWGCVATADLALKTTLERYRGRADDDGSLGKDHGRLPQPEIP